MGISLPIDTYNKIYAQKSLRNPPRFVTDDLTLSSDAPFVLEMDNFTFSVNMKYVESVISDNLIKVFDTAVCDIEKDGLGLRVKRCGIFYLSNNMQEMIVSEKMKISV